MKHLTNFATAFLVTLSLVAASTAANAKTYKIDRWPADANKLPCEAWTKNADGSYTQKGSIVVGSAFEMSGNTFAIGTLEAEMLGLEARCTFK